MQKPIIINEHDIIYELNEKDQTASAKSCHNYKRDIFIPTFVNYKSKKYVVKSILSNFINIHNSCYKTVQFAPDSQLESIEKNAFSYSSIESIKIPSTVKLLAKSCFDTCVNLKTVEIPEDSKLQVISQNSFIHTAIESISIPSQVREIANGAFNYEYHLKEFIVSPLNPNFKSFNENTILAKKTNPESTEFDCLVYGAGGVETIQIPNFIKYISEGAFYGLSNIRKIEIQNGTKLEIIGKNSIAQTSIKSFIIPSSVKEIKELAFCESPKLEYIEFEENTKIRKISKDTFYQVNIKCFKVPSQIEIIERSAFHSCFDMKYCIFPDDSMVHTIGEKSFNMSGLISFSFPPKVKQIVDEMFAFCRDLKVVEIRENSEIESINLSAFNYCTNDLVLMIPVGIRDYLDIFYTKSE